MKPMERLARPAEFLLGAVFIVAALLKALDVNQFAVQIYGYGLLDEQDKWVLGPIAVFTIGLETFLGCAMLLGVRVALLILTAAQGMLIVFTCFILYGWIFFDLKDCGCFGAFFKLGPEATIAKNIILLAVGGVAWIGFIQKGLHLGGLGRGYALKLLVSLFVTAGMAGYAYLTLERLPSAPPPPKLPVDVGGEASNTDTPPSPPAAAAEFAGFVVEGEGKTYRLAEGEYLVALLSMTCEHCMASVPVLNSYVYMPDLPPLVGLGYEESAGKVEEFKSMTMPEFPIHSLGDQVLYFFSLIGKEPPRLCYVVDGKSVHHWDIEMPAPEEILAVIEAQHAGEPAADATEAALTE